MSTFWPYRVVVLLLLTSLSFEGRAAHKKCLALLNQFLTTNNYIAAEHSVGMRGLMVPSHILEPEHKWIIMDHGLFEWGLKIYQAESLEAAQAHDALIENPLLKGAYIIGPEHYPLRNDGLEQSVALFNNYSSNQFYWFEYGEPKHIPQEISKSYFHFGKHSFHFDVSNPRNSFLYQDGWFFPRVRGVILFDELKTSSSIVKYAQQIYDAGYTISFNKHFFEALDRLREQVRKNQDASSNRYGNKGDDDSPSMKNILELYHQGLAFSVEVVDPSGHLVAGNISYRRKTLVSSDTVFYDHDARPPVGVNVSKEAVKPINLAKVANWALSERLAQAGISFYDIGMVSGFSSQTRGRLISFEDFLALMGTHTEEQIKGIDLESHWVPPARR